MDRQAIFNTAYIGLASQGFEQSRSLSGRSCAYRGSDGRKCAIGHCIPDDKYDMAFEGVAPTADLPIGERLRKAVGADRHEGEWLRNLQYCHDNNASPVGMRASLEAFASKNSLIVPALPTPNTEGA